MKKIDLQFDSKNTQIVFDVLEFVEKNKKELLDDIRPTISSFLKNEDLFTGPYFIAYNEAFKLFVLNELKLKIIDNFNIDAETAMYLTELLDLTGILEYFLNKDNYFET